MQVHVPEAEQEDDRQDDQERGHRPAAEFPALKDLVLERLAGAMAWWVPGSRDVINGIAIEPPERDAPIRIQEALRTVLEKNPLIDAGQIRVGVRQRVVRLTGIVHLTEQREMAERDAWSIFGVDKVINEIVVKS